MTDRQFIQALMRLNITQVDLANALNLSDRSVRYWVRGDWPVPDTIAALLNLMLKTGSKLEGLKI